jgi:multidrug efflux system membrane fusion protein
MGEPANRLPAGGRLVSSCRLLGTILLLPLVACAGRRRQAPPPVPVTVAQAHYQDIPYDLTANGTVEPIRTVAVASQVSGMVMRVGFREGDDVAEGQLLFQIDPRPYDNALEQARATLARDIAQLENAQQQVTRYEGLSQSKDVTAEQFDAMKTAAAAQAAAVKADSAAVANAQLNLEYTDIRAPIAGRTGSVLVKAGNLVRVNSTGPLVVINQLRPIQVRFSVPAGNLPQVRQYAGEGTELPVTAEPANDSTGPLHGVLTFVDNAVDSTTGTIMLKARFANADERLWPGEFVTTTLRLYVQRQALIIPSSAIINGSSGSLVFVIGSDGRAATRDVTVGRSVGDDVIVESGLSAGETVVTDGQLRLTAGAAVEIKPALGGAAAAAVNP